MKYQLKVLIRNMKSGFKIKQNKKMKKEYKNKPINGNAKDANR